MWFSPVYEVTCPCGVYRIPEPYDIADVACPSCMRTIRPGKVKRTGTGSWFYWFCFPGCLPEGDGMPVGPFATEAEAIADARETAESDAE